VRRGAAPDDADSRAERRGGGSLHGCLRGLAWLHGGRGGGGGLAWPARSEI
jgi:hypothetical protein